MSQQALGFGEDLHHVHTSGLVHHFAAHLEALSGNPEGVLRHVEAMKALARQHRVQAWRSYWTIWEGWARGQKGEHGHGIELMREGIALQDSRSQIYHAAYYTSLIAQLHARAGEIGRAIATCLEARERAQRAGEEYWEAELRRIEGECRLAAADPVTEIEARFDEALAISRKQGAKMFELRAAMSLASLRLQQGRSAEARDALASAYGWFTEGFDSADLKGAKALLRRMK